jgi:Pectate lyase superfamily protein
MRRLLLAASVLAPLAAHASPYAPFRAPGGLDPATALGNTTIGAVSSAALAALPVGAIPTTDFSAGLVGGRSLSARFADTVNILDHGAKCDGVTDDTAAINASLAIAAAQGYAHVLIPHGTCYVAGQISATLTAGQGIDLDGADNASLLLPGGASGPIITLAANTATFAAHGLRFMRASDGSGTTGTGLTVQMATGITNMMPVRLDHLTLQGSNRADTWQTGIKLVSLATPTLDSISVQQPDATGASSGPSGLVIQGMSNSQFAIDTKISNSSFQGGHANFLLTGSVQGVFITNSEGIGSDYGVYGSDDGTHSAELVKVEGGHWNNVIAGVSLNNYGENIISNNLFLHFNPQSTGTYAAVQLLNSGYNVVSGNIVNGAKVGNETMVQITNGQFQSVFGNQAVTLGGNCIDMSTGGNANSTVTGNMCANVNGAILPPTGSNVALAGNTINGTVFDIGRDGSGLIQTVGKFASVSSATNLFPGPGSAVVFTDTGSSVSDGYIAPDGAGGLNFSTLKSGTTPLFTFSGNAKATGNLFGAGIYGTNFGIASTGALIFQKSDGTNGPTINLDGSGSQVNFSSGIYSAVGITAPGASISGTATIGSLISDPSGAAPLHNTSTCSPGQQAWDAIYEYRCIAANSWQRTARGTGTW